MRTSNLYNGPALIAIPLVIQLAMSAALCWRYAEDARTDQQNTARIAAASQMITLAQSLRSVLETQQLGSSVTAGRALVRSLQTISASPSVHDSFDPTDYDIALGDLKEIESLLSRQQISSADSYRPHLLSFCTDQVTRAHGIVDTPRSTDHFAWFVSIAIAGIIVNGALTAWLVSMFNAATAKRLAVLQDNAERLQHGISLNKQFSGTDGFASLDKRFHDMAGSLEKAQERLKKGENRLRLILEHMPVGVMIATLGGAVESANPKAYEIFGYRNGRFTGRSIAELFKLKDQPTLSNLAENPRTVFTVGIKPDGTEFSAALNVTRYRDDVEDKQKLLISFEDITWRTEVEKMKREFMAMISHDIRTPLTSISATLGMLAAGAWGSLSEKAMKAIENDEDSLDHVMRLLNDLLSIEKFASGSFQLEKKDTWSEKIVRRALFVVNPTADSRDVKLILKGSDVAIYVDEDRMVQLLTNLLTNAVKFSPEGGTVTVEVDSNNEHTQFAISDQGPGIAVEDQEKIFEKFGQVKSVDFAGAKGMGLGLAISKQIVEQHGGAIGVRSELGKGTTFWVTVPPKSHILDVQDKGELKLDA